MSIAGGLYKAVERAEAVGAEAVQLFSKSSNQWKAKLLTDEIVEQFQTTLGESTVTAPIIHDSYLINLASPKDELWEKSIAAFQEELERATRLAVPYVVTHPGSYTSSDRESGLRRIAEALDRIHDKLHSGDDADVSLCLLETTAGQGTNLGCSFEDLEEIFAAVRRPELLGVCVDTCHVFAAGYDISKSDEYEQTVESLDRCVGLDRVKAFHLNDSKKECGSRVDRHEHIGQGCIGEEAFRMLLNDARFTHVPMYLETPKGGENDQEYDLMNLARLRSLFDDE
jgi:deoxyribonuclease IV